MLVRPLETLNHDHGAIKRKIESDYSANESIWQVYWVEATRDCRLEAGDTTLLADLNSSLPNNNMGQYYFNRTRPLCNMVSGYQRRNRKKTVVVGLENADNATSDQWTKLLMHVYKKEQIDATFSDAFHQGACVTGMNLLHVYLDWSNDPISGDVKVDNLAYNQFFIDPYFRKHDLSDCRFIWRRTYMSHAQAAQLMPEHYEDIMALPGNPTGMGRDGKFQFMPEAYGLSQQNRLAYDEYYYRTYRKQKLLVDKMTGETLDITFQESIDVEMFLAENPQVKLLEQDVPTVNVAILIQDQVFYNGRNFLNTDDFPFIPILGYYNSMMPYFYSRIQGICRSLRDPQMLLNRRIVLSADMLESVLNSGFIFNEDAILDVKHFFQTGNGRIIPVKDGVDIASQIVPIQPPQIPPSFFQMQDTFSKELNLVSGINEELMGSALDDKAGILSQLRQGAGLTTLQPLFDRADFAQKMLGELLMKVIGANYVPGKVKSILEGQEPTPFFHKKSFGKYHCAVELGFDSDTQKQMSFAQAVELRSMGVAIPDEYLLEQATLQNKDKLIEIVKQNQQAAQQAQQKQMEFELKEQEARTTWANAKAFADKGSGAERFSRIEENKALAEERRAEAFKDDQMAILNMAKALKELQSLDITQLETLVSLQRLLKEEEQLKTTREQNGSAQLEG